MVTSKAPLGIKALAAETMGSDLSLSHIYQLRTLAVLYSCCINLFILYSRECGSLCEAKMLLRQLHPTVLRMHSKLVRSATL